MKNPENLVRKVIQDMPLINWSEPKIDDIRLIYGENIVGLSDKIKVKIKEQLSKDVEFSNLYTVDKTKELSEKLAEKNKVNVNQIVIGNGIDDLLKVVCQTFIDSGDEAIVIDPSYRFYDTMTLVQGGTVKTVSLKNDFSLDINDILEKITPKTKIIFIANPNNPTGNILLSNEKISELCSKFNGVVVIDECYHGISEQTALPIVEKHNNLIIARSFSKSYAMAGLRLGYLIANEKLSKYMNSLINNLETFRVNRIVCSTGIILLDNEKETISKLKETKKVFYEKLKTIENVKVYPSETTFFMIELKGNACDLKSKLEKHRIIIKDCSMFPSLGKNTAVIGIPKNKDIDFVIEKLKESI
jgi:histidinol-phosphate aminotransferase